MLQRYKYHFVLHVIIFVWGFTALLGRWIETGAFTLVFYRVLIAFVSLLLFMILLKRKLIILSKRLSFRTLGVGIIVALHWLTFFLSIKSSSASLAIICLATTTIHVSWLEPIVMRRKFQLNELFLGCIIVSGILLITQNIEGENNFTGVFYGLISALLAAMFSVFNAHLIREVPASKITLYEMFSATLISGAFVLYLGGGDLNLFRISLNDFWLLLFLGVVCTSIAFLVTVEIVKHLGAFTVSLSINMEPIYTLILAAWLLGEHKELTLWFYVGSLIILFAVFGDSLIKHQLKKRKMLRKQKLEKLKS